MNDLQEKDAFPAPKCSPQAIEFKQAMAQAIIASGLPRKIVAYDLGYQPSDLLHWLSLNCESTLPAHLIQAFCGIVGNRVVLEHVLGEASRG